MQIIDAEGIEVVSVLTTLDENNEKKILIAFRNSDRQIENRYISLDNAFRLKNDIGECLKKFCYKPPVDSDSSLKNFIRKIRKNK